MAAKKDDTYSTVGNPITPQGRYAAPANRDFGPKPDMVGATTIFAQNPLRSGSNPAWEREAGTDTDGLGNPSPIASPHDIAGERPTSWPEAWQRKK